MAFTQRILEFFLPYRQRLTAPQYDVDFTSGDAITSLTPWDWADLNLIVFNDGAFWADWLTDWLFPIVSGTATQVGAVRTDVAQVAQDLVDMELRLGGAIAGGQGQDMQQLIAFLTQAESFWAGWQQTHQLDRQQSDLLRTRDISEAASTVYSGLGDVSKGVKAGISDGLATIMASLGPILEGVTKDFVGDREKLDPAFERIERGEGGVWMAVLPLVLKGLVYALQTGGPILALALGKEVLEHFPRLRGLVANIGAEFGQGMVAGVETLHGPMRATMGGLANLFFTQLQGDLAALGESNEENVFATAAKLLGTAGSLGASAHLAALVAENIAPLKHMGFGQFGAFLVDLAGFEGIARNSIGVQFETALREPARRRANRVHRPNLPDKATMEQMFLERRLAPEELADFYRTQGWPEHFIQRWLETLPIEATPRDLAIVFEDVEIDPLWAQDHLRQRGFTDEDAFKITEGLRTRAVKSQRAQAVGALVANYADGLLDNAALAASLQGLRLNDEAVDLTLLSAEHKRQNSEAEKIRSILESAAAQGAITVEEVGATMAAYGYDARASQQAMGRARLKLGVQLFRDETSDVKAAVRRAQQDAITAAMELFRRFQLDAGGLASYLRQWGIKDDEVDALVALAAARRQPVPRLPEVLTLEAELQQALRVEQDGILELTRKGLMTESAAASALAGLGMDSRRASAEAHLAAARRPPPADVVKPPTLDEITDATQRARADAAVARFRGGLLSSGGLSSALRSAGVDAKLAAAVTDREIARAEADRAREARDLLERQLREERDAQERAAVQAFRSGRIDAGGLLQNLLALGISSVTAQAIVDREMIVKGSTATPAAL